MDKINPVCSSFYGPKILLHPCTKALKWVGLDFWVDMSRSIFIIKGSSANTTTFSVSEPKQSTGSSSCVPSIHFRPIEFLSHIIDGAIFNRDVTDELEKKLITGM